MPDTPTSNRFERRRARTRAALIGAARALLAEGAAAEASIQSIADRADIGFGSFYNHFESKTALFDAAVTDALEEYGQLIDTVVEGIEDPAEVFSVSVRMTVGMVETHPELAHVLRRRGIEQLHADTGLAPRALRDIEKGVAGGRFSVEDPRIALSAVGGSLLGLLQLESVRPDVSGPEAAGQLAALILRMLGLPPDEAREVAGRPLPPVPGGPVPSG
ncbi:TetR/AcrR family transcriptional regulator [Actinomycetota bacterium Odt1-20B]